MVPPPGCRAACALVVVLSPLRFFPTAILLQISSACDVFARSTISLFSAGMALLEDVANRHVPFASVLTLDWPSRGVAADVNDHL
jgi:hypothetical protein